MSIPSAPPGKLPKKDSATDPFDRWLYDFWAKVNVATSDGDQNIIAVRSMLPHYSFTQTPANDTQSILATQIFGA